jgi:hypothetical protein
MRVHGLSFEIDWSKFKPGRTFFIPCLDLETAKAGAGTKAGSNTLYIVLGIGAVVVLGVVIFAVTRKK